MAFNLCDHKTCTACSACIEACSKRCITLMNDECDVLYPEIDRDKCIQCGLCQKVCPSEKDFLLERPFTVYAAWNSDQVVRKKAASGGIASAFYSYAIKNGIYAYGVADTEDHAPKYIEIQSDADIERCRNSKYVFSNTSGVYNVVKAKLAKKERVLFIGLPCQIAGLLGFLGGRHKNLITVDIICHGTCPAEYLQQHIRYIENKKKHKASIVQFRDPQYGTCTFTFTTTFAMSKQPFYKANVNGTDVYQIGYHKALFYRENCYYCKYATEKRIGDITIGDFSGLGKIEPYMVERRSTSCVMVSTTKGNNLIKNLIFSNNIICLGRPVDEAFKYERQLQAPSVPHKARKKFLTFYADRHDFENSAHKALKNIICKNSLACFFKVQKINNFVRKMVPQIIKENLKRLLQRK